jgi:sortase A
MAGRRRRSRVQVLEWVLALSGLVCLGWYDITTYRAIQYQRQQARELERAMERARVESRSSKSPAENTATALENPTIERPIPSPKGKRDHQLIGRLEIPRVQLSVMVVDGDDAATLKVAAGHLPDTPLPWEFGNSAVAGHRDSFFRPLSQVKMNDRLRLVTPYGEFHYVVSNMRVVKANDLSVLAQTGRSSLTLVTCYPFSYVGRAPKRFVVRADHVPG